MTETLVITVPDPITEAIEAGYELRLDKDGASFWFEGKICAPYYPATTTGLSRAAAFMVLHFKNTRNRPAPPAKTAT
jgi:hypothetical protein